MLGPLLKVQMCLCVAGARDSAPCPKWAKMLWFSSIPKNDGRRGAFQEDLQRCISRSRRSTRDMFIRDAVRRSGCWFPERGRILEHQIFRFAKMILCDRCSSIWPGITFSWQAQYFRHMGWKNRKTRWYEAVSSALNFPFLKEVSQNCFVFDVVNFENSGRLSKTKIEEVSQNSLVLKLAERQIDR